MKIRQFAAALLALVAVPAVAFATPIAVTPEPATWAMMAAGLVGVALIARKRK